MKRKPQSSDVANTQPDNQMDIAHHIKDFNSKPDFRWLSSDTIKGDESLQAKDISLLKNYSQFFIELS